MFCNVVGLYTCSLIPTLLKMGSYSSTQRCVSIGTIANLLSSILTILLTCPNNDTVLCYSNDPFLTVHSLHTPRGLLLAPCTHGAAIAIADCMRSDEVPLYLAVSHKIMISGRAALKMITHCLRIRLQYNSTIYIVP